MLTENKSNTSILHTEKQSFDWFFVIETISFTHKQAQLLKNNFFQNLVKKNIKGVSSYYYWLAKEYEKTFKTPYKTFLLTGYELQYTIPHSLIIWTELTFSTFFIKRMLTFSNFYYLYYQKWLIFAFKNLSNIVNPLLFDFIGKWDFQKLNNLHFLVATYLNQHNNYIHTINFLKKNIFRSAVLNLNHRYYILMLNFRKKQLFFTLLSHSTACIWNCSAGLVLKDLISVKQKYIKQHKYSWIFFLKFLKKKFMNIIMNFNSLITIKGLAKYFLNFLLYLIKFNFLNNKSYLILKCSLAQTLEKIKSIKAVKRKLVKRFFITESAENQELKTIKKAFLKKKN